MSFYHWKPSKAAKKEFAEKVAESDLDEELKKEILANLKGGENDPKKAR